MAQMITSGSEDNNIPNNINSLRNFSNHARCGDGDDDDKPRSGGCGTSCDGGDTPGVTKREGLTSCIQTSLCVSVFPIN